MCCIWHLAVFGQRPVHEIEVSKFVVDTGKQLDLIDLGKRALAIKPPAAVDSTGQKVYFSILPFSQQVPGGGHALITSTTAGFYLGERSTTYISRINFTPYTNFGKRIGIPIRSYIWLKGNAWVIDGDIRMLKYPHETWGVGQEHHASDKIMLDYSYLRVYQHVLKRMKGGLFLGLGYNLDYRMDLRSESGTLLADYTAYPYGTQSYGSSISSGLSFNVIYDTRANSINAWDGNYANLQFRFNPTFMGSSESWRSLFMEMRRYHRLTDNPNRQNMIAIRHFLWTVFGSRAPYMELPNLGWDPYNSSGRGFPLSRYRGKSMYYMEAEYRRDITENGLLGFVVFTNANTVSGPQSKFLFTWNVAAGAGARVKFNKKSGTNIALDYGVSKQHRSIHLTLGEVF
ncbi:BamA/TamA family outer membrane protein [Sphingobacterium griseoflavum]|uniref:Bacterial surface antigen (D15) domain-containing protein n=1 Tax=Sphingobacterium griseoflavum TaxID=1474952 RepID=A0ABQ3I1P9_9SPHI|nr:BamA/TamA family outer membrane protein [Sphingobacterium griseoflavum]GHE45643.1 hypothetical protein GCM10017764_31130 [Sphingobacterium griseoflavum]